jgi:aspartyl-tRNA(Asn)/glutamyl-tRNA(Gln) amidotransferase subunit A
MNDPALLSLADTARAIASREISSVEVVKACLKRAEEWQEAINCFVEIDAASALRAALACDQETARGRSLGRLHGVPLAHKDMFARRGSRISGGANVLGKFPEHETATVLQRLDDAGAISIGRLNMSEFASGPTGHNEHWGNCRNPWNPSHITGGSSSGSGAAVAAGIVFSALGSDTGGSIRLPAAICGVVGLRPTYGRVSRAGAMPRSWSLDVVGPLARTALDCAIVAQVIAGHDSRDVTSSREPVPDYSAAIGMGIRDLRVACAPAFNDIAAYEICDALEAAFRVIVQLGAGRKDTVLPDIDALFSLSDTVSKVEAAAVHAHWMETRPTDYSVHTLSRTEVGLHIPAVRYLEALAIRGRIASQFVMDVFEDVDALILPVLPMPTPTLEETDIGAPGEISNMVKQLTQMTRPLSFLGLPVLTMPVGFDHNGLPIGVQLVGRPFSEAILLRIAHAYQQATEWHTMRPQLSPEVRFAATS